ncbi:MAG: hypothetical protein ACRET5_03505, partial [Steroidobacteraceae bacterium]
MKTSRLLLLAAAQLCWTGLISQPAVAGTVSTAWSDLWRTQDQQGQALLAAGKAAQAADRFHDPKRRAYADLEAGRYQDAAKLLAPFSDAESEYNLGNALAKAGQLQAALAAYDAALKQTPADKDIRHNRDLVERALQKPHQSPQSSSRNGRQGGGSHQSGSSQQPGSSRQAAGGGQTASNGSQAGTRGANASKESPGQAGRGADASKESSGQAGRGAGAPKESPGQAERDAAMAATLAREQRQHGGTAGKGQAESPHQSSASQAAPKNGKAAGADSLVAGGARTPRQKPESERQLALDQWLRQIPDSPAG